MNIVFEFVVWGIIGALPGFYIFFARGHDTRVGAVVGALLGIAVGIIGIQTGLIATRLNGVVTVTSLLLIVLMFLPNNLYGTPPTLQRRIISMVCLVLIFLFLLIGISNVVFFERNIDPGIVTMGALVAFVFALPRGNYTDSQPRDQRITNLAYALTIPTITIVMGIVIFPVIWNVILSLRPIEVRNLSEVALFDVSDITADGRSWSENFQAQAGIRFDRVSCELADGGGCAVDEDGQTVYENPRQVIEDYRGWRQWFNIGGGETTLVVGVQDPEFYPMIIRTLVYTFSGTVGAIFFGLVAALIVRDVFPGRAIFRGFLLFPYIAPVISVAFVWRVLLRPDGLVNGVMDTRINFLGDNSLLPLFMVILFQTWRYFPFAFLFLLARIQAIPDDMYEAAKVDGATPIERLWFITLPQLRAVFGTLFLLRFIWTFNKFDDVFLLTGAISQTKVIPIQIYEVLFIESNVGEASAVAVIMAGILSVILMIYFRYFLVEEA
ncbi:MAG: sugar ABC transporter permease [Chloroflexota bacterium]